MNLTHVDQVTCLLEVQTVTDLFEEEMDVSAESYEFGQIKYIYLSKLQIQITIRFGLINLFISHMYLALIHINI